jgi:hypothetical protein
MKKLSLIIIVAAGLVLTSCEKVPLLADVNNLGVGSYLTRNRTINSQLDYGNLSTTQVGLVAGYKGVKPKTIIQYVTEGPSKVRDRASWKKIQELPWTGDSITIITKATQIAAALGVPPSGLKPGQTYMLYQQIIGEDGKTYDLANTGGDFEAISNYNMALTFSAIIICPYVPAQAVGQYKVLQDQWDQMEGTIVNITAADVTPTTFSFALWPNPAYDGINQKPVTLTVNANTGNATATNQVYGDYIGFANGVSASTVGTGNWVFSCSGTVTLLMNHKAGTADFGNYRLLMQKQ